MLNIKILAKNQAEYEQFNVSSLSIYYQYQRLFYLEQDHFEGVDAIVILSPLTAEEQKIVTSKTANTSFLIFIGVNIESPIASNFRRFTTKDELLSQLKTIELEYVEYIKQDYINTCIPTSKDDELYLKALINEKMHHPQYSPQKKAKRLRLVGKRLFDSKGMVSLVGNTALGIELVKTYQRFSEHKILLIDGNLLKPTLDVAFNIREIETKVKSHLTGVDNTGINIMLDAIKKSIPIKRIIDQVVYPYTKSLDLLFGNYNYYNYEHYDAETLDLLFSHLKNHYTTIFIILDAQFYDELTLLSLHKSDINVFIGNQNLSDVRFLYNVSNVLEHKQGILKSKNYYVFDKKRGEKAIGSSVIKTLFKNQVISCHPFSTKKVATSLDKVLLKKT